MVKYIIEVNSRLISDSLLLCEESILIINEECFMSELQKQKLQHVKTIDSNLPQDLLYIRVNSQLCKGILIGKLLEYYPRSILVTEDNIKYKRIFPNFSKILDFKGFSSKFDSGPQAKIKITKKPYSPDDQHLHPTPTRTSSAVLAQNPLRPTPKPPKRNPLSTTQSFPTPSKADLLITPSPLMPSNSTLLPTQDSPKNDGVIRTSTPIKFIFDSNSQTFIQASKILHSNPLPPLLHRFLQSFSLSSIKKFHQLFHLISQFTEHSHPDPLPQIKELIHLLFKHKCFTINEAHRSADQLFRQNCWNLSISYKNPKIS